MKNMKTVEYFDPYNFIIAQLWKSEGYTGFALSFSHSVIP